MKLNRLVPILLNPMTKIPSYNRLLYQMRNEETYEVKEYLRYRVANGVEQVLLSWVGYRMRTWEPLSSLFLSKDDEEYMKAIRDKYKEVLRKYEAKGLKVDALEIINPHLKNAKLLQHKLDLQYRYPSPHPSSESSSQDGSSEEESLCKPKKVKEVRRTTKRERRQQIARRAGLANLKRIERSLQPLIDKEDQFTTLRSTIRGRLHAPQQQERTEALPSKVRLDFKARFHEQPEEAIRARAAASFSDESQTKRVALTAEDRPLDLIFKLLQRGKIQRMFFNDEGSKRNTYFEVSFDAIDTKFPIIFHEDYLMQCCSSKMVKYFMGQQ